jgi:hypothetical protein
MDNYLVIQRPCYERGANVKHRRLIFRKRPRHRAPFRATLQALLLGLASALVTAPAAVPQSLPQNAGTQGIHTHP